MSRIPSTGPRRQYRDAELETIAYVPKVRRKDFAIALNLRTSGPVLVHSIALATPPRDPGAAPISFERDANRSRPGGPTGLGRDDCPRERTLSAFPGLGVPRVLLSTKMKAAPAML